MLKRPGLCCAALVAGVTFVTPIGAAATEGSLRGESPAAPRSLDGSGNNLANADWGRAGTPYLRVAAPAYADGLGEPAAGPPARWISNRVFNDTGQNLFSENGVTQWGWVWAQFIDHDMGLRDTRHAEPLALPHDGADPLEGFASDRPDLGFARTPAVPGTGTGAVPREQVNTVSSFLDGSQVYGTTADRLAWLRDGAHLLLPDGFLPHADARGDTSNAPPMDLFSTQHGNPASAVVTGDVRANENVALTALHTLFAREHNRIVDRLPAGLSDDERFEIARRVVGAEIAHITYTEFLPALGVDLPPYRGYDPTVDPALTNEFATTGFRGHSMVHGEFEVDLPAGALPDEVLSELAAAGVQVAAEDDGLGIAIPLGVAFGNPQLIRSVGLDHLFASFSEVQYRNDEQIDDALRSVLFQVPQPGVDPAGCAEPAESPNCFSTLTDLGAIDVLRGRDHGIPGYTALREALGLEPVEQFGGITGEPSAEPPADVSMDDPRSLEFTELVDADGTTLTPGTPEADDSAVSGTRRTSTAARLEAVYGQVDAVDAFTGMVSEPHLPGSDLGELQTALWVRQFTALRDGDRYFYGNDPELDRIAGQYGVSHEVTLAEVVTANAGPATSAQLFRAP
ncbi:peroxidase family protein [Geodermatophilus sp. SYSU D00708]